MWRGLFLNSAFTRSVVPGSALRLASARHLAAPVADLWPPFGSAGLPLLPSGNLLPLAVRWLPSGLPPAALRPPSGYALPHTGPPPALTCHLAALWPPSGHPLLTSYRPATVPSNRPQPTSTALAADHQATRSSCHHGYTARIKQPYREYQDVERLGEHRPWVHGGAAS